MRKRKTLNESEQPVFMISIVSKMLDVHPQTLRAYEREGLVTPSRRSRERAESSGGQRLYSKADVERLELILELTRDLGVNRAGVDIILRMRERLESLQREVELMMERMEGETREEFRRKIQRIFESE